MSSVTTPHNVFGYQLHYSAKRRSVALQIKQGKLIVRAPFGFSRENIHALLEKKQRWILKHLDKSACELLPDWLNRREIPRFGNLLKLEICRASQSAVSLSDNSLIIAISSRVTDEKLTMHTKRLLLQYYRAEAMEWFSMRVAFWQQQMQLQAGQINIGSWKTKWGYCRQDKVLGFNWRLLMAPQWVADYVVIHELAHLNHLNHSAAFWASVEKYYPQHREASLWLRKNAYWMDI